MDELYRKLLAQLEEGQDTVLAFITEGDGSIPRTTGAYMLVGREGRIFGTIGGGNLEYQAVLHAQELVQEKKSEYREYDLGTGEGKGLGMVCGGRVKVCFYFMNGAHGEAESLAQALAAQERYRSYWIFFALDGTGIRVLEKEAWEMLPAAQEKAGHCRILELDGKTYYAEEFCYDGKVYLFGGGHLAQELVPVLHHLDFCCIAPVAACHNHEIIIFPDRKNLVQFRKIHQHGLPGVREQCFVHIFLPVIEYDTAERQSMCAKNWKRRVLPENSSTVSMPRSELRSEARRRRRLQSALPHSSFRSGQQKPENEKVHIRRFIRKYTK